MKNRSFLCFWALLGLIVFLLPFAGCLHAQTNPIADLVIQDNSGTALTGIPLMNGTSPVTVLTIGTNLSLTGGTLNATGSGSVANPTATIGLTAVNGTATSAIRSDGAPALSQAITPTWTGQHIFANALNTFGVAGTGNNVYQINIIGQSGALGGGYLQITNNATGTGRFGTGGQLSLGVTNSPASTDLMVVNQTTGKTWDICNSVGIDYGTSALKRFYVPIQYIGEMRVVSDFPITSSITLSNVTGLLFNAAASGSYHFRAVLYTTAVTSGGVKAAIGGTATVTNIIYEGILYDTAAIVAQTRASALGTAVCSSATSTVGKMEIDGTILVNAAGTLTVQFAQNTSNASASTVLAGSTFTVFGTGN